MGPATESAAHHKRKNNNPVPLRTEWETLFLASFVGGDGGFAFNNFSKSFSPPSPPQSLRVTQKIGIQDFSQWEEIGFLLLHCQTYAWNAFILKPLTPK